MTRVIKGTTLAITKCTFWTVAVLIVAGCNTTEKMHVPVVSAMSPVAVTTPAREQASFTLGKVVVAIPRGTTIAHFPVSGNTTEGTLCNRGHSGNSTLDWSAGSAQFGDWRSEFGDIFFEVMQDKGVNVVGDPKKLFQQAESAATAEYLLGARIREIKGNFCESHHWWDGKPLREYSGEFFIRIEWSVYSTLTRRTVTRFDTTGHHLQKQSKKQGIQLTFLGAFAAATENLLAEKAFVRLLSREPEAVTVREAKSSQTELLRFSIPWIKTSSQSIERRTADVTAAVATIRLGRGHGSGFIISETGHLLTNQHVVKLAKRVQVVFANGLEVTGEVLRRDAVRDVALVKIPIRARSVLPIRKAEPDRLEEVYAIGSPILEGLAATITKGIVSAWRKDANTGLRHIQADVSISSGNSGGPLVDGFGNVVGISVATIDHPRAQSLNLFIPIHDALESLNIQIETQRTSMSR